MYDYGQEVLQISENKYLRNNEDYYNGREATPSVDNQIIRSIIMEERWFQLIIKIHYHKILITF